MPATKKTALEITCQLRADTVYINLTGYIHYWTSASSYDVALTIKEYKSKGATKAQLYINSEGGSCFEAQEIKNLLIDNFGKANVKTRVGALAASAGTIFFTDFYTTAKRNSQLMIHKPSTLVEGNEDVVESDLRLLKNITKQYRADYARKMKITEADVEVLWAKGDYWMTAQEALQKGLIDAIETDDEVIDASAHARLVAAGAPYIPPFNPKTTDMTNTEIAPILGLSPMASDTDIRNRIAGLQTSERELTALKQTISDQAEANKKANIKALLDGAEAAKKIKPEQRTHYQTLAEANYESCKAIIDALPSLEAISAQLAPKPTVKGQENWTFEDYQKNPEAWKVLEKSDPKKAEELIAAHYKDQN